jgi:hypothetical protein
MMKHEPICLHKWLDVFQTQIWLSLADTSGLRFLNILLVSIFSFKKEVKFKSWFFVWGDSVSMLISTILSMNMETKRLQHIIVESILNKRILTKEPSLFGPLLWVAHQVCSQMQPKKINQSRKIKGKRNLPILSGCNSMK